MANGYTPGSFTPRAGGKSYTEMLGEQVQSIKADRQQRLDRAFNRNQAERQLKSQRMSTVLNIDTTGMAPDYAQSLSDFKSSIIESLDSSSDTYYGDGEAGDAKFMVELANLVQAKNASDGHYQIGSNGAEGYTNSFGKVDAATGRPYVGNKEDLDARSQMWDSGLFENMGVTGEVGNRQITGIPLNPITINPDTKAYESVRIGENAIPIASHELLLDATPFWTAPTGDAPMISDELALDFAEGGAYASLLNPDISGDFVLNKEDGIARSAFRTDGVLNDMRQEWLRENAGKPIAKGITTIDQWDDERWAVVGLSEELAFKKFQEIGNAVAENRAVEFNDKSFVGQGQYQVGDIITYSIFDQKTQKSRAITVASEGEQRKVSFVGLDGTDPTTASFVYVYDLGDGVLQTATIPVNSGEGRQIVEGIGGESALAALVDRVPRPVNTDGQDSDQPNNQNNQQQGEEEEVSETEPVDVPSNLEAARVELEYEIQQIEGEFQNIPPERRDLAKIDRLQKAKRELSEINQRLSGVQENPESYTSNEDFESYLSEVKDSISFFSTKTPAQNLAKKISGLTPPEQAKAINEKYDEIEAKWNSMSNNLDTPRKKVKASELETQMAQLEEMRNRLGYSEGSKKKTVEAAAAVEDIAPETAAVVESAGAAINPNTQKPVKVTDSPGEKQEATMMTLGGLVEMEKQEADIVEDIRKISVNVLGDSIATWQWNDWQKKLKRGEETDPVPAWCAAWMADMIMRANPDFDFDVLDYAVEGKPGERAEKEDKMNRVRARFYKNVGTEVPKISESLSGRAPVDIERYDGRVGDIVVKSRMVDGKKQSHVGFFVGYAENGDVLILGGNQNDELNVTAYPYSQVDAMRRLEVPALTKEQVETISADIKKAGKTT